MNTPRIRHRLTLNQNRLALVVYILYTLTPAANAGELVAMMPQEVTGVSQVTGGYQGLKSAGSRAPGQWESSELSLGVGISHFNYDEAILGGVKSKETGLVKSVTAAYRTGFRNRVGLGLSLEVGGASSAYDGTLQTGVPLSGKSDNLFIRGEFTVSYRVFDSRAGQLRVYGGQSYRVWRRDLAGDAAAGYRESYAMTHFAVGTQYRYFLTRSISVAPDLSVRFLAGGSVKADIQKFSYRRVELPLGGALGARVAVPITFWSLFGDGISLVATPYYEYVGIGQGKTVALQTLEGGAVRNAEGADLGWYEPASSTHTYGATFSAQFHW